MLQQGNNYLKMQRAYPMLDKALDVIGGIEDEPIPQSLSDIYTNRLKRQAREVVATISNMKPIWTYKSDNPLFMDAGINLNKIGTAWWQQTFADQKVKKALQWSMISTGYVMPIWSKDYWCFGRGDIDLQIYGPRDVLPIGMGRDHDLQNCYAVIICTEVPVSTAFAMYPDFADKLKVTRNTPSWYNGMMSKMRKITSKVPHLLDIVGAQKEDSSPSGPTIDIYHVYINDTTINRTGKPLRMGKIGTSWDYEVPFLGESIVRDVGGVPIVREARKEDCRLYPLRRLIVATDTAILDDNSSPWWHGKVPLAKFTIDEWPDQFLGYSVINDAYTIQKAMNQNLRGFQDRVAKILRPDVTYDPEGRAKSQMQHYDPRVPGQRIPINAAMGDGVGFLEMPEMDMQALLAYHETLKQEMDHLMAIPDMRELARANQVPAQDTLEKLMEIAGPVVQDMSRTLEHSMQELGEMVKTLIYQFYPPQRSVSLLGASGITYENFEFDKNSIIPVGYKNQVDEPGPTWLLTDNLERARQARNGCIFHIMPGSLHQITQTQYKMFLLQFWRDGRFPIDPQTVAEGFNMTNFGNLPNNPITILERWKEWQEIMLKFQIKQQAELTLAQVAIQQQMAMAQLGNEIDQLGGAIAGAASEHQQEGRPPSGSKPPHQEVKKDEAGAPRPVVSES